MITRTEYETLKIRHEEGCKNNDYSKMIMMGDENHIKMKEYEQEFICKHTNIIEKQGGQIEECLQCGKQWR